MRSASLVKIVKTIVMAAAAAALHSLVENIPSIVHLIPPKYAGAATILAIAAALYHKAPPSGDPPSSGLAGAAGLGAILVFLCGAFPRFPSMAGQFDIGRANAAAPSPTTQARHQFPVDVDRPVPFFDLLEVLP